MTNCGLCVCRDIVDSGQNCRWCRGFKGGRRSGRAEGYERRPWAPRQRGRGVFSVRGP